MKKIFLSFLIIIVLCSQVFGQGSYVGGGRGGAGCSSALCGLTAEAWNTALGTSGFIWKGSLSSAPSGPSTNWAYYNTTDKKSYIYNSGWQTLTIDGTDGSNGTNGTNGTNGATWYSGSGAPSDATGSNGDFYLRTSNGAVYVKAAGAWGSPAIATIIGTNGTNGTNGAGYGGTSTTSLEVGTGSKSFTTQAGMAYAVGSRVRATSASTAADWMEGVVTSYSSTTLVINVDTVGTGADTKADWNLSLAGQPGQGMSSSYDGQNGQSMANNTSTYAPQAGFSYGYTFIGGYPYVYLNGTNYKLANYDANNNLTANNHLLGYATTATAAGTTTLTAASANQQFFTGSTTQTVALPVTSTLATGHRFLIINNSSGVVTVNSSGGNTLQAMAANSQMMVTCISTSGTGTSSWAWQYIPWTTTLPTWNQDTTGSAAKIPSAASPTIDAAGKIGIDTTTDQLKYYGGAERVIPYIKTFSVVVPSVADTDDIYIMKAPYGMTMLSISCIVSAATSATINIQECGSDGTSCTDTATSDLACDTDGASTTTFNNAVIDSGDWIKLDVASISGTPGNLAVTVTYSVVGD